MDSTFSFTGDFHAGINNSGSPALSSPLHLRFGTLDFVQGITGAMRRIEISNIRFGSLDFDINSEGQLALVPSADPICREVGVLSPIQEEDGHVSDTESGSGSTSGNGHNSNTVLHSGSDSEPCSADELEHQITNIVDGY